MMYCFPAKNLMKSKEEQFLDTILSMYENSKCYAGNSYHKLNRLNPSDVISELNFIRDNYNGEFEFGQSNTCTGYDNIKGPIYENILIPIIKFTSNEIILQNAEGKDINLGKFKISLSINKEFYVYDKLYITYFNKEAVALNPNPCASSESVTHPNISDGTICLGEADGAVCIAFREGRFSDIAELIINVLNTHSDSPYVHINDWFKQVCGNCGNALSEEEEFSTCEGCHSQSCSKCSASCLSCEKVNHDGCLYYCQDCSEKYCYCYFKEYGKSSYQICDSCYEIRLKKEEEELEEQEEKESKEEDNSKEEELLEPFF